MTKKPVKHKSPAPRKRARKIVKVARPRVPPARAQPAGRLFHSATSPYGQLRAAALQALSLLEEMGKAGALRLPFQGYQEAVVDLRRALA